MINHILSRYDISSLSTSSFLAMEMNQIFDISQPLEIVSVSANVFLFVSYLILICTFRPDKIFLHRGSGNDPTFQHISAIGSLSKVIEIHQIYSFQPRYWASVVFQYIMLCLQNCFRIMQNLQMTNNFFQTKIFGQSKRRFFLTYFIV